MREFQKLHVIYNHMYANLTSYNTNDFVTVIREQKNKFVQNLKNY